VSKEDREQREVILQRTVSKEDREQREVILQQRDVEEQGLWSSSLLIILDRKECCLSTGV